MDASLQVEKNYDALLRKLFEPLFDIRDYRDPKLGEAELARARKRKVDVALGQGGLFVDVDDKACCKVASTGNIALETFTVSPQGTTPGWMFDGEMAWVRYGSCYSPDLFFVPMYQAKTWLAVHWRRFESVSAKNARARSGRFTHMTYSLLVPARVLLRELPDAFHVRVPAHLSEFPKKSVVAEGHPKTVDLEEAALRLLAAAPTWPNNPELAQEVVVDSIAGARYYSDDVPELRLCALPDGVDLALLEQRHRQLLVQQVMH